MQKNNTDVPYFNSYNPSLDTMQQEQLEFYDTWVNEIEQGNYLDIKGNLGYIYVYISRIFNISEENKYDTFYEQVLEIQKHYSEYQKIAEYCNWLISDYYVTKKQYKEALFFYPRKLDPWHFALLKNAGDNYTIKDAVKEYGYKFKGENNLTDFGKSIIDEIQNEIVLMYKEIESSRSVNIIDICTTIVPNSRRNLFRLYDSQLMADTTITQYEFDSEKFSSYILDCYRVAENRVRQKMGLPLIGQGWLGETKLYYEIKKTFSDLKVTQHEKLPFLRQQHLDVFIHQLNVGLEYQGDQHIKPVDYFGGEANFKKTLERDERKKVLCEQNGISLIYVYPGYDINEVLLTVKDVCANRGTRLSVDKFSDDDMISIQNEIDEQYFRNNAQNPINKHVKIKNQKKDKFTKWLNDKGIRVHDYNEKELSNFEDYFLKNLDNSEDPIDKHYWLSELSYLHYRHREHQGSIEKCIEYCLRDIELFEDCMTRYELGGFDSLISEFRQTLGHNPTPDPKTHILMYSFILVIKRVLVIYEKLGQYDMAIDLCNKAIKMEMKDISTKHGFEGRITYLQRMKSNNIKVKDDE